MVKNKITTEEILEELARKYTQRELEDGEFTIRMFMEKTGLSNEGARKALEREVALGKIEKETMLIDSNWVSVFRAK